MQPVSRPVLLHFKGRIHQTPFFFSGDAYVSRCDEKCNLKITLGLWQNKGRVGRRRQTDSPLSSRCWCKIRMQFYLTEPHFACLSNDSQRCFLHVFSVLSQATYHSLLSLAYLRCARCHQVSQRWKRQGLTPPVWSTMWLCVKQLHFNLLVMQWSQPWNVLYARWKNTHGSRL